MVPIFFLMGGEIEQKLKTVVGGALTGLVVSYLLCIVVTVLSGIIGAAWGWVIPVTLAVAALMLLRPFFPYVCNNTAFLYMVIATRDSEVFFAEFWSLMIYFVMGGIIYLGGILLIVKTLQKLAAKKQRKAENFWFSCSPNVQTGNTYYTSTTNWLLSESPDIIGLQEVGPNWYKSLKSQLGGTYGYVGVPRSGTSSTNSGNEASPIFYKKSEYKLIDSGTKWLSNTPDTVGSKISGSLYIRVMTYAVLYHKDTGTIYIYVNTHLDNADSGSIRVKQMQILMNLVDELPNYPTILTGDLNGGLESGVINAIQNTHGYTNLAKKAAKKDSTYKTATFWETNSPCVIDYIFLSDMSKFNALSYKVGNSSSRCSVYKYSDHYALISTFNLK